MACLLAYNHVHPDERRRQTRFPTNEAARLTIPSGGIGQKVEITTSDMSRNGIGFVSPIQIALGSTVLITWKRITLFGDIRYCRPLPEGFRCGLKIRQVVTAAIQEADHLGKDLIERFARMRGLSEEELQTVIDHIEKCESCRSAVVERQNQ